MTAMAMPWMISAASGPHMWTPTTLSVPPGARRVGGRAEGGWEEGPSPETVKHLPPPPPRPGYSGRGRWRGAG